MTITSPARKLRHRTVIIPGGSLTYILWNDQREEVTLTVTCTEQAHCQSCGCSPDQRAHVIPLDITSAARVMSLLEELTPPPEWG